MCIKHKAEAVSFYGTSCFHLALGSLRVSKILLVTGSLLQKGHGTPVQNKQQSSMLPYQCLRLSLLNNLPAGWLTDTRLPHGSGFCLSVRAPHVILPPLLWPSLCIISPPSAPQPCPIVSFWNKSFSSLWLTLLFLAYFFSPQLCEFFLPDIFIQALCAVTPHGN